MTRIKSPTLASIEKFEDAIDQIARLTVQLHSEMTLRDQAIQQTRDKFAPSVGAKVDEIEKLTLLAEAYAKENRATLLPGKEKTAETALARFGFRLGNPTTKTKSGWTWKAVLNCIVAREITGLIRTPDPEVNKEALLALHANPPPDFALGDIGVRIVQSESFFIEPKERSVS